MGRKLWRKKSVVFVMVILVVITISSCKNIKQIEQTDPSDTNNENSPTVTIQPSETSIIPSPTATVTQEPSPSIIPSSTPSIVPTPTPTPTPTPAPTPIPVVYPIGETDMMGLPNWPDAENTEVILYQPHLVDGENKLGFYDLAGANGPKSFFITDDNEIYINNMLDYNFIVYKNNIYKQTIQWQIMDIIEDFIVHDNKIYSIAKGDYPGTNDTISYIIIMNLQGDLLLKEIIPNLTKTDVNDYSRYQTVHYIRSEGNRVLIGYYSTIEEYEFIEGEWVEYIPEYSFSCEVTDKLIEMSFNGKYFCLEKPPHTWYTIPRILKCDGQELIFNIIIGYDDPDNNIKIEDNLLVKVNDGEVEYCMQRITHSLPAAQSRELFISNDFQIYQMWFAENYDVYIFRLKEEIDFNSIIDDYIND